MTVDDGCTVRRASNRHAKNSVQDGLLTVMTVMTVVFYF